MPYTKDMQIRDYERVIENHHRLVRELDLLLNGAEGAAKQASLVDIIGQVRARREVAVELANKLEQLGVTRDDWSKSVFHYFSHTGGQVSINEVDDFFRKVVNLAQRTATFLKHGYRR